MEKNGNKPDSEIVHEEVTREELEKKPSNKKQARAIRQTTHNFSVFDSSKTVDSKINEFLKQKFLENANPMISKYIKGYFGSLQIITLHTETIEI